MNQVLVQVCFLVSGVVTGCSAMPMHVPTATAVTYSAPAPARVIYVDAGPVNNITAQPNWRNIKRSMQPDRQYTQIVVVPQAPPTVVYRDYGRKAIRRSIARKRLHARRANAKRRIVARRHY
jgi:hypothetical protein